MAVDSTLRVDIRSRIRKQLGVFPLDQIFSKKFDISLPNGTADGQANRLYIAEVNIGDGAVVDLDLAGALEDVLGDALVFVDVRAMAFRARDENTTLVTLGNDAADFIGPFDVLRLSPGMIVSFMDEVGWPVTATTADIIQFTNAAGAAAVVDVVLIGTDA